MIALELAVKNHDLCLSRDSCAWSRKKAAFELGLACCVNQEQKTYEIFSVDADTLFRVRQTESK